MMNESKVAKEMFLIPSDRKQLYLNLLYAVHRYRPVHQRRLPVPQEPPRQMPGLPQYFVVSLILHSL